MQMCKATNVMQEEYYSDITFGGGGVYCTEFKIMSLIVLLKYRYGTDNYSRCSRNYNRIQVKY